MSAFFPRPSSSPPPARTRACAPFPTPNPHFPVAWMSIIDPSGLATAKRMFDSHVATKGATQYNLNVCYTHKKGHEASVYRRSIRNRHEGKRARVRARVWRQGDSKSDYSMCDISCCALTLRDNTYRIPRVLAHTINQVYFIFPMLIA